ncbi:MAG: LacI family DNA-binding transcriptional regulator [Clostridiales bacterium]|nr:LacI family DNA-binding transcriptional regulator [Clostridiales bacterium]
MKASIYDVAKKSGVSVVTVSRVINNASTVRQSSRDKVMKAIKELNYQPSSAAQSLARGKTNVIGLLIPDLTDPFIMEVVDTVDRELEKRGYFLALSVIGEQDDSTVRSNFLFQQDRVDGILILTPIFEEDYVTSLKEKNIPFVIMDNQLFPFTVSSIVVDNFKGGYDVTRHLLELGHLKFGCIGGPEDLLSAKHRVDGFNAALREVGVEAVAVKCGEFDITAGYEVTKKWIEEKILPTAVICGDDHIAFGVIDALREYDLKVPEDVSVVGYDDHPFASKLHPNLTTVKQPAVEIGKQGVEALFNAMKGKEKQHVVVKLAPELIVRHTTSVPKK